MNLGVPGAMSTIDIAREIARRYPTAVVEDGYDLRSPLSTAWFRTSDRVREIERTHYRDPEVDFSFSMAVIPCNGRVYGLLYTEVAEFDEMWYAEELVERYPYWNNADPPDGISWEEWEERGREWNTVLEMDGIGGYDAPALRGFSATCVPLFLPFPKPEEVLAYVPTFEERVMRHAKDCVVDRKFREIVDKEHGGQLPQNGVYGILFRALDYLKSEAGMSELSAEQTRLKGVLVPDLTKEHLLPTSKIG